NLGSQLRSQGLLKNQLVEVMHRHHVGTGHEVRDGAMRDVKDLRAERPQQKLQAQMIVEGGVSFLEFDEAEVLRQVTENGLVGRAAYKEVFVLWPTRGKSPQQALDVGSDAESIGAADIEAD